MVGGERMKAAVHRGYVDKPLCDKRRTPDTRTGVERADGVREALRRALRRVDGVELAVSRADVEHVVRERDGVDDLVAGLEAPAGCAILRVEGVDIAIIGAKVDRVLADGGRAVDTLELEFLAV